MKKLFLLTVLLGGILSACSNNSTSDTNIHKHDDGSTHADHTEITTHTKQEEFAVDSASADTAVKPASHTHDGSESHTH